MTLLPHNRDDLRSVRSRFILHVRRSRQLRMARFIVKKLKKICWFEQFAPPFKANFEPVLVSQL